MLARGVLCRLTADVPKTSTHDLPQLARLLQRRILSRNGFALPAVCALSRAYGTARREYRRSYATAARATKPTARVKKDVKKAAAKKPTKRAAAKKPAAKKKAVPKKKKKVAAKPKRVKKVVTPEAKEKKLLSELRKKALKDPGQTKTLSAFNMFIAEAATGVKSREEASQAVSTAAVKFKNLTPAEREHYNHLANEKTAARKAEYDAWIRSHTPEQIRIANIARTALRRKLAGLKRKPPHTQKLRDDRAVKRPITSYLNFAKERRTTGDFKNISSVDAVKLIANEWKALSASEKKRYQDAAVAEKTRYEREFKSTYGHASPSS